MENTDSEFFPETDSNSTISSYDSIPLIRIESIDEITIESSVQIDTDSDSEVSSLENDIVKLINDDSDDEIITEDDFTEFTNKIRVEFAMRGKEWDQFIKNNKEGLNAKDMNWAKYP